MEQIIMKQILPEAVKVYGQAGYKRKLPFIKGKLCPTYLLLAFYCEPTAVEGKERAADVIYF